MRVPSDRRWSPGLLALALGGAATLLVVITLTARHAYRDIADAALREQQAHDVRDALRQLRRHLGEIQVGHSGYLITGRPVYRRTFDDGVAALAADTFGLRALLGGRPGPARLLDGLEAELQGFVGDLRTSMEYARRPRREAADLRYPADDQMLLTRVRPLLDSIEHTEALAKDSNAAAATAAIRLANRIALWALLLGLVLIAGAGGMVILQLYRREAAEARLRHIQRLLLAVMDGTSDAIFVKGLAGHYELINRAGAAALGAAPDDIVGRNDAVLLDEVSAAAAARERAVLESGAASTADETLTPRTTHQPRLWNTTRGVLLNEGGQAIGIFGIARDVTERQRLEEQRRQSQKLEAVGQLAGGVAHDFNNLLAAITSLADLMLMDDGLGEPHREDARDIRRAAEQAAGLTRQLLAYSRRQVLRPQLLNVNGALAEDERLLRRTIGEHIDLQFVLDPAVKPVVVDPGQLSQVALNLAINARDAMPGGGRLTFETANVTLGPEYAAQHAGVTPGD